jgi:hypothetical protein
MTLDPITSCPRRNLNHRHWRSDGSCKCPPGTMPLVSPVGLDLPDLPDDRIATLPLPRPWWRS